MDPVNPFAPYVRRTMSADDYRLSISLGCVPCCHTCDTLIEVGERYALVVGAHEQLHKPLGDYPAGTVLTVEVMVCWDCRRLPLPEDQVREAQQKLIQGRGYLWKPAAKRSRTIAKHDGKGSFVVSAVTIMEQF